MTETSPLIPLKEVEQPDYKLLYEELASKIFDLEEDIMILEGAAANLALISSAPHLGTRSRKALDFLWQGMSEAVGNVRTELFKKKR